MLLGLIVKRIGNYFQVYSTLGDFRLAVSECGKEYDVGKWIGLRINGSDIAEYGLARSDLLRDLPVVRVQHNVAEVQTKGTVFWRSDCNRPLCETVDFGIIPVICRLPAAAKMSEREVKIWVGRFGEESESGICGWGVVEFVGNWDAPQSLTLSRAASDVENEGASGILSSRHCGKRIHLEGLIISAPSAAHNGSPKAYIWTRYERESLEGVLYYGSHPREFSIFKMGQWIGFHLPLYPTMYEGGGAFVQVSEGVLRIVNSTGLRLLARKDNDDMFVYDEQTLLEASMEVPLSVPVGHLQGDDFYHEEIGAVADPDMLLQGGQEYETALVRIRPRPSCIENEVSEWKVIRALALGESWAPSFSRKKSKIKRPLCGRVKPRPLQRDVVPSPSATSIVPPKNFSENGLGEQCGDKVDSEDRPRWIVEPKFADLTNRQTVTALAMVEMKIGNGKYRVWMLEYHREAEFFTSRSLDPGHFFQGRFHIGGRHKDKCHEYIQEVPDLLAGRFIPDEGEVEVVVAAVHTNRRNGAHYEVFHHCLGYVLDTSNLLRRVESRTEVEIVARRKPVVNGGRLIWQIVDINRIK